MIIVAEAIWDIVEVADYLERVGPQVATWTSGRSMLTVAELEAI